MEVKRSSDTRIRRRVVGQMMDYAANAVRYGDVHSIRRTLASQTEEPEAALEEALGISDPDAFWKTVATNLERGAIRMIFVADRIPRELRRIVEFLNEQMRPAEVLAVEVKQYAGDGLKTLVSRVHGQTEAAEQVKERSKTPWDESTFFDELEARTSKEKRRLARRIYDWARERGCRIEWLAGDSGGGFYVCDGEQKLFKITVSASIWTRCAYYEAIVDPTAWGELQERMSVLGLSFPDDPTSSRQPQRSLPASDHEEWWKAFEGTFQWLLEEKG